MPAVNTVLIVGGGTAGCSLAILLARAGVEVGIAEIKTDWTVHGSGITLQGNALRVLREVGVLPEVLESGFAFDELGLRSSSGAVLAEIPDARTGGPDLPATVGMDRPRLAEILSAAATRAGAEVLLGLTASELRQDESGVDVTFNDGTSARYDLVVGADGIRSHTRSLLGITTAPRPTGMSIWRVHTRRPPGLERTDLCYDGPCYIAGYCPTGADSLYAYLVEDSQDRTMLSSAEGLGIVRGLAAGYHGFWDEIRASLDGHASVNHTAFESLLVPAPWNRGRVALIGDAVHACPPTLAQGAAMCLEDASVLADVLLSAERLDQGLLDAFTARRFDRTRTIVDSSLLLTRWIRDGSTDADVPALMNRIAELVTEPA
ncbi:2-polyprenyl-6-methoxyphenol hydroxylase-like FAD-dependent oxidoreductase [Lipingzhangella halophila]|uniref:2-polyprenyl-6-methoxyphenol hydroxylase-like FAD-dependent oxidoreductase n=1 Tax=Lipingzhangella halophila TaxID=1783352 RepID=A0A7W7RNP8_9ACTN|nr:FAD-dependent oxidoreductase [Lipingzhangella halophila]MBB4934853.1 2-polyprenyl-6-methoxyphenol hydroxylase-like FAD-dependent oxidoreductase [Lipingzhangella halophila]